MDLDVLGQSPVGRLVPINGSSAQTGDWRYWAFVPASLPREPRIGLAALNRAAQAAMEVARLDQAASQLPNPEILVRPIVRREAVSTSALEGTYVAFDELLESDFLEERQLSSEQREVRNYVLATEQAIELLKRYPICRSVVGQLQKTIVRGTPGDSYDSGDLRQRQVCIGAKGRPIEDARFVPTPPGDDLVNGFSDWEKWVNSDSPIPLIAKVALAHYQFETLHPFADGNGRLGRLIAILQLSAEGVLHLPILNVSPWLEDNRRQYLNALLDVTKTGDFDQWIEFFSTAIEIQARGGTQKIRQLVTLKDSVIEELRNAGMRGSGLQIAENLIGYPVIDVRTAQNMTGATFQATNKAVSRLVELGVIRETTGRRKNRLFVCERVFRILSAH